MTSRNLLPDLEVTKTFLEALDAEGEFTFQTFDDNQDRRDGRLAKIFHGRIEEHARDLITLQNRGAGVFVVINKTDLNGRKLENILDVRSVFADLDGAPLDRVIEYELEPHIIIESSSDRWHAYWLCEIKKDQFSNVQRSISAQFDGDRSVNDLPRVMRLPGFFHQKIKGNLSAEPFMTRIEQISNDLTRYRETEIQAFFEWNSTAWEGDTVSPKKSEKPLPDSKQVEEILSYLDPSDRDEWVAVGHALKATSDNFLCHFLDFSEGLFKGEKPSNYVSRDDAIKNWNSFNPVRTGFGSLVKKAKALGYRSETSYLMLKTGSQVEIAKHLKPIMEEDFEKVIYDEGSFWGYLNTHWHEIEPETIRKVIYNFDGLKIGKSKLKLSKNFIDGVINELSVMCYKANFFALASEGVNLKNGFVSISRSGSVQIINHSPDHRQRFCLGYNFVPELSTEFLGLLDKLFKGCFGDQYDHYGGLILEIYGAAICGIATKITQPKVFILYGQSAENGKSSIQKILRKLLPKNAYCSIPPADMDKEQYLAKLVGKTANLSDELSGIVAISSDKFKAVITGDPVTAKVIYQQPVDFIPRAQHILSTNVLPNFKGGVDAGIERRLVVIPFNRKIPVDQRIADIDEKVVEEQGDMIVSQAIRKAAAVLQKGRYSIPESCIEETCKWMKEADPVKNWLLEGGLKRAVPLSSGELLRDIYIYFRADMKEIGVKYIPGISRFNKQLRAFISDDPSWEEIRSSAGQKLKRSDLVTKMTGSG